MFPLHSVLRYHPSNDVHYTSKVLQQGVLQLKGGPRRIYSSVEEWLRTLPGSPEPSSLIVTSEQDENEQRKQLRKQLHEQKRIEKKKTTWHVPPARNMLRSLPWARYIYGLIRKHHRVCGSGLLQREDMRLAYNHLVKILTEHSHQLRTCTPLGPYWSLRGVHISELKHYIIPIHTAPMDELTAIVTSAYSPLYTMLCDSVIPYMERVVKERRKKRDTKIYQRLRAKYVHKMMILTARYEREAEHLRSQMDYCQDRLNRIETE
jgi:hypothetical protein